MLLRRWLARSSGWECRVFPFGGTCFLAFGEVVDGGVEFLAEVVTGFDDAFEVVVDVAVFEAEEAEAGGRDA